MKSLKYILSLMLACAQICQSAYAYELPAWCGRYLLDRSAEAHLEAAQSLGFLPLPMKVMSYAQGTSANPTLINQHDDYFGLPGDREKLDLVVTAAETKIKLAALKAAVESFYTIHDLSATEGSRLNLTLAQIPGAAAALVCNAGCSASLRDQLRAEAKLALGDLVANHVPRQSLPEAAESLKASIAGLNSLLADLTSDTESAYWAYRRYYLDLLATPAGAVLSLESFAPTVGRAFTMSELAKSRGSLRHGLGISAFKLGQAINENYNRQQNAWRERAAWLENMANTFPKDQPRPDEAPLVRKLGFYLNTAPLAVAEVFQEHKELIPDLCWMFRAVDSLQYDVEWKSSVSTFAWYIAPINIGIVAGFFLVGTGGAALIPLTIAALALKGVTAYEVYRSYQHANGLAAEARVSKLNVESGLGGVQGLEDLGKLQDSIEKDHREIALVLTLEMASYGSAESIARRAEQAFAASSAEQKLQWLNLLFKSRSGSVQLYRLNILTSRDLAKWYRSASPEEVEKLLFKHNDFGFGKTLLLTESGIDVVQEGMRMAKTPMFEDINPFTALFAALQAN